MSYDHRRPWRLEITWKKGEPKKKIIGYKSRINALRGEREWKEIMGDLIKSTLIYNVLWQEE